MDRGYIKSWRKVMDSTLWQSSPETFKLAYTCLHLANYRPARVLLKTGQMVDLRPGQFVTTSRNLAKEACLTRQITRTALSRLESESIGFLTQDTTNGVTIITIINWPLYQSDEENTNPKINPELTQEQPNTNPELTLNKKDKKEKKEEKREEEETSEPKKVPQSRPAKSKKTETADEPKALKPRTDPHGQAVKFYCDLHLETFNVPYKFEGGKDAKIVSDLLTTYGLPLFRLIVQSYFQDRDEYLRHKGRPLGLLMTRVNRYAIGAAQSSTPSLPLETPEEREQRERNEAVIRRMHEEKKRGTGSTP